MGKIVVTIFILANIFLGYFAEASQGEAFDCKSSVSQSTKSESSKSSTPESSDRHDLTAHCHFAHCAVLKQAPLVLFILNESQVIISKHRLSPADFVRDLLRPPIAA